MKWLETKWVQYEEAFRYVFFGVLTTSVNVVAFYGLSTLGGIPYLLANAIAIVLAILFAYYTNSTYVFKSKARSKEEKVQEFGLFVSMRAGTGVFDMLSMFLLVSVFRLNTTLAKVLTQGIDVVLNYLFNKLVVFK